MARILVFGDSITYGSWDPKSGGWVARLRKHFDQHAETEEDIHYVYNLGVSGDTTTDVLKRFKPEATARISAEENNIIVFALGVNDALYNREQNTFQTPKNRFEENVDTLLGQAHALTENALWIGPTPVDESRVDPLPWRPECSYLNEHIRKYNNVIRSMCGKKGVQFLNVFNAWQKLNQYEDVLADGVHPTSQGHEQLSKQITPIIQEFVA